MYGVWIEIAVNLAPALKSLRTLLIALGLALIAGPSGGEAAGTSRDPASTRSWTANAWSSPGGPAGKSKWSAPTGRSQQWTERAPTRTSAQTTTAAATLTFDATCAPGKRAVIAAVGDLLFHDTLQLQALRPNASFRAFWAPVAAVLAGADLTYGNLESPIAHGVRAGGRDHKDPGRVLDRVVYGRMGTELVFNTHPSVAADLAASGFDVVSTANNHSADRGVLGMDRTLDALDAAGLAHTGVRRSSTDPATAFATRTTTRNGITVAWLACTYGLNGLPDPKGQVLQCFRDQARIADEVAALASDPTVDAVVVTPHWGLEGSPQPQAQDRRFAREIIDAGATAIIGTHPHVLQPWEKVVSRDGRDALIIYSTGNFISNQQSEDQRTGQIALIEVTKPDDGARARLSAAGYIPTFVEFGSGHRVTELRDSNASVRRLPAGNRVSLSTYRTLPRACAPQTPDLVARARLPAVTTRAQSAPQPIQALPSREVVPAPSSPPTAPAEIVPAVDRQPAVRSEAKPVALQHTVVETAAPTLALASPQAAEVSRSSGSSTTERPVTSMPPGSLMQPIPLTHADPTYAMPSPPHAQTRLVSGLSPGDRQRSAPRSAAPAAQSIVTVFPRRSVLARADLGLP